MLMAELHNNSWTLSDLYLFCFALGGLWSLVSVLGASLGGGQHGHGLHGHAHTGHLHAGHGHAGRGGFARAHAGHGLTHSGQAAAQSELPTGLAFWSWIGGFTHPSSVAIFLAWFGGAGFLIQRHTGWALWLELGSAALLGLTGASVFAWFLRWLQSREKPLDPADYQMPGVLGRVSSTIRPDGVGEMIYLRDGARTPLPARSDKGELIARGEEVVVTRYERGVAYVRSFQEMVSPEAGERSSSKL